MKKRILSLFLAFNIVVSMIPLSVLTAFAENGIRYGDADGNGKVELLDVNLMERYIAEEEDAADTIHFTEADVNADGAIDDEDVQLVKEYLVGNISSLAPELCTITFNTDGGSAVDPITAGVGYTYKGTIPVPGKDAFVFVNWVKEDGSVYYQAEDVISQNMTLTAVYEPVDPMEQLNITSFSLSDQPTDVSFSIYGEFSSVDEVKANITVLPKDGSDPVEVAVKDNGNGNFTVYAPEGFNPGASYELTLGDGLYFADKDEMFRTVYFIIKKEEVDNLQYNPDMVFIKDTDKMNYTIGDETIPVLESALLSNDESKEAITGSFTMPDGDLETDDIVCIYENVHPNDRDYTKNDYEDDALAYIRITGVSGDVYQFESLDEEDSDEVLAMPDSIPYKVDVLPKADGTVNKNDYDAFARSMLGKTEAPAFDVNDFLIFYTVNFEEINDDTEAVYGQITNVTGDTVSYKIVTKEAIDNFMSMFVSQDIDGEELKNMVDENQLVENVQKQVEESGFVEEAGNRMILAALDTEEVQQKLLSAGMTRAEIETLQASPAPLAVGAFGGKTKFVVDGCKPTITPLINENFENGIGVAVSLGLSMHVERKMPNNQISTVQIELSAYLEQEVSLGFDVNIEDRWKWYFIVPVLEDLDVTVSIDVQDYTYMSVGAKIYTLRDEKTKKKWKALSETVTGPNASPETRDLIIKINKLAAKIKKATARAEAGLETLKEEYENLKSMLPSISVDGVMYSVEEIEKDLQAEDVGSAFEESMNASTGLEAKTGMDQLMERYQEMLNQESEWIDLCNAKFFEKEFHIKVVAVKVSVNGVIRGNVNLSLGADMEYQVGKRYSFWLHIMDLESGSSEMDLIDERFGFQFYVMGTLGLRAGVKLELACGLLSTSLASIGANVEVGIYVKIYGYFIYFFERLRPIGSTAWNETEEMMGALFVEVGWYVTAKFKAQALANTFKYEPTLYDKETPLLTAGEKKNAYNFALEPDEEDILYIWDEDENSLNGISMMIPSIYRTMKTMDLVSGSIGQSIYLPDKFVVAFTDSHFSVDDGGKIRVDTSDGSRYLRSDMRIVWKCSKLAFSKFDMDITIPVIWTNMSESELNEKFTASVAVGNMTDGYETVWSGRYGRIDQFDLPSEEEILELINYDSFETDMGNLKYASVEGYQEKSTGISLTTDKTFYFNVTPRQYTLKVEGVQKADGSTETRTYQALYGEEFDLENLQFTGANDPKTNTYSSFQGLTDQNGEAVISVTADLVYAQGDGNNTVLKANYLDNTVTATYNFIGLGNDVEPVQVKFKKGSIPAFDGLGDYVREHGGDENIGYTIDPQPAPSESSVTYTVICKAVTEPLYTVTFETNGGTEIKTQRYPVGNMIYQPGETVREGYTFAGWYADEQLTQPFDFSNSSMPEKNITIYAKWNAKTFTVDFDTAGNAAKPQPIQVQYGSVYGTLPVVANNTLKFVGWFTEKTGGTEVTAQTTFTELENQTLYARWENKQQIQASWFTYEPIENQTFDYSEEGITRPFTFTVTAPNGDLTPDDFTMEYKTEAQDAKWTTEVPVNAGTYSVRLRRDTDNNYQQFETIFQAVLRINKLDLNLKTPDVSISNWIATVDASKCGIKGDGVVTYYLRRIYDMEIDGMLIPNVSDIDNNKTGVFDLASYGFGSESQYAFAVGVSGCTNYNDDTSKFTTFNVDDSGNGGSIWGKTSSMSAASASITAPLTADGFQAAPASILPAIRTGNMKTAAADLDTAEAVTIPKAGNTATMTLSPLEMKLKPGDTFDIDVQLDRAVSIWGIYAAVGFDTNVLELTGYSAGGVFRESQFTTQNNLASAPYKFLATLDTLDTVSGKGTIITLHFRLKNTAVDKQTAITIENLEGVNANSPIALQKGEAAKIDSRISGADTDTDTPAQTGENTDLTPWIALFIVSGSSMLGICVVKTRKKRKEH